MGYGPTDMGTLAGFLDINCSSHTIMKHMKAVEQIMGPIQIKKKEESMIDAIAEEVTETKAAGVYEEHKCKICGHEHPPLPMLTGSYGNII